MSVPVGVGAKSASGKRDEISVYQFYIREFENHRELKNKADCAKDKWVYVFSVESWGVRLLIEAQCEDKDKYKLVDWKTSTWDGQNSRPATKEVSFLSVKACATKAPDEGVYACLSGIQIPRWRLQQYIGNTGRNPGAKKLVLRRCTRLGPLQVTEKSRHLDYLDSGGTRYILLFLQDPILIADAVSAEFAIACRKAHQHREKNSLEYTLAGAAIKAAEAVVKDEDDDFVEDGKFKMAQAKGVVRSYDSKEARFKTLREAAGRRYTAVTASAEYDEALKDFNGDNTLEEECIKVKARHTVGKLQTKVTRNQLRQELLDKNSFINKYLFDQTLFHSGRKFTTLVAEFGDILGEYGEVMMTLRKTDDYLIFLQKTVLLRAGFDIIPFRTHYPVGTLRVYHFDVQRMATNPSVAGKLAGKAQSLLIVFEAVNLALAWEAFQDGRKNRKLADYAGPLGALCDLAGAVGSRIKTVMEKSERELALKAGKGVYKESRKLVILGRVMAIIGMVGGICDMIEARGGALQAAQTLQYERIIGFSAMYMGAALGTYGGALALAGLETGPIGWIAVGLVLIGLLIINYFKESKLETWLRNSTWGDRTMGKSIDRQLSELDLILARFAPDLKYHNLRSVGFGAYSSNDLEVIIKPGFVTAKSRFDVTIEVLAVSDSYGSIDTHEAVEIDVRSIKVRLNEDGSVQPITYRLDLINEKLRAKKVAGFKQNVRVKARLDLFGDRKTMVPESGNHAWWWFRFEHGEKKFKRGNSEFK